MTPLIVDAGHTAIAVDLPVGDEDKGLADYATVVADAARGHQRLRLVTHSMSAFIAPMIAKIVEIETIILVAPMVPRSGEPAAHWMANTGQREAARRFAIEQGRDPMAPFSITEIYLHDVPDEVVDQYPQHHHEQAMRPFQDPWPLASWPSTVTRCIVGRYDRLFPYEFQRRVVSERLGLIPEAIDSGHLCALSSPGELVRQILGTPRDQT